MKRVNDFLTEWVNAVNKKDLNKIISFYADEAVLVPTFSNIILNSPEKIKDYFTKLLSRKELSCGIHQKTINTNSAAENVYIVDGIYFFRFAVDEEPLTFEARFSIIADFKRKKPIIHHHSSQIPRLL